MVDEGGSLSRYSLVVINFLTLLAGMAATATGIYSISIGRTVGGSLAPLGSPIGLLLLGIAISLVSLLGMYSASAHNVSALRIYFIFLVILLIVQMVMSTLLLAKQADVDFILNEAWESAYLHNHQRIEKIEKSYACCGYSSVRDRPVPKNCIENDRFGFVVSCRDRLVDPLKSAMSTVGWTGMGVAGLIGLGLILTLAIYGDIILNTGGYERESVRMAEARQMLREGNLSSHQRAI